MNFNHNKKNITDAIGIDADTLNSASVSLTMAALTDSIPSEFTDVEKIAIINNYIDDNRIQMSVLVDVFDMSAERVSETIELMFNEASYNDIRNMLITIISDKICL